MKYIRLRMLLLWMSCIAVLPSYAAPDTTGIPAQVVQHWNQLQQKNALDQWLYARMDYVDEAPEYRLPVLMQTLTAAWRSYSTYPERLAWFDVMALQGYYLLQTGNVLASIQAYEKALLFYEAFPLPEVNIIDDVLKPLGNNYTRLADYDRALYIHGKALQLVLNTNDPEGIASVYCNMAVCARWKGDLSAATGYCNQGLRYNKKKDALQGLLFTTYADILSEKGQTDSAVYYCNHALSILKAASGTQAAYWYGSALQLAASLAMQQQQYKKASGYAITAQLLYNTKYPASRQREKGKLQVLQGNIALAAGELPEALHCFQSALLLLLPSWHPAHINALPPDSLLYGENTIQDALQGKANVLKQAGQQEFALQHLLCSFQVQLLLRQEFFYTGSKLREIALSRKYGEMAMQLAYSLWQQTKNRKYANELLRIAEITKAQVLLEQRLAHKVIQTADSAAMLQQQLQRAITYYKHELLSGNGNKETNALLQGAEYQLSLLRRQLVRPATTLLTASQTMALCAHLPASSSLLEFFEGSNNSFLIEAKRDGVSAVYLLPGVALHDSIAGFMKQWFADGPAAMVNAPRVYFNQAHVLYKTIFNDFKWTPGTRYLIVPDGMFSSIPFDALITSGKYTHAVSQWQFLYKQAICAKAWSLQTWVQQQHTKYLQQRFSGFFVSAAPGNGLPALQAGVECDALKKQLNGDFYKDSSASYSRFMNVIPATGILHVSMHATAGQMPALQLYDGPLFLSDLQYARFSPALVVLTACRTADGNLLEGEGVNSLERGFVAAGAGGVLSSLWNINDQTATELSQLFYKQLAKESDATMALRKAREEWILLHKNESLLQLPYYWAAFNYSGHWQPVSLHKNNWYLWAAATVFILVALTLFYASRKSRVRQ